jgi:protein-tyrosine phosphatase
MKKRILFICLGNICRSPAADGVMRQMVEKADIADRFIIDSAGIGPWHVGELPDKRMRRHGADRGYTFNHIARQFDASHDFDNFDYIVVMDEDNYKNITRQARTDNDRQKVIRMADYLTTHKDAKTVPDPYYGGDADFEYALDLIEDGCRGLINDLK